MGCLCRKEQPDEDQPIRYSVLFKSSLKPYFRSTLPPFSPYQEAPLQFPELVHGSLSITINEARSTGSGVLLYQNIVLTAAQNLYNRELKARASSIQFQCRTRSGTYVRSKMARMWFPRQYQYRSQENYGLIMLQNNIPETGSAGLRERETAGNVLPETMKCKITPYDQPTGQLIASRKVKTSFYYGKDEMVAYKHKHRAGHVGAALWQINARDQVQVVGVHIGTGQSPQESVAVFLTEKRKNVISSVVNEEGWCDTVPQRLFISNLQHGSSLIPALAQYPRLLQLCLFKNRIRSNAFFQQLVESCAKLKLLQSLSIIEEELGPAGCVGMASMLNCMQSLWHLDLSSNRITSLGFANIFMGSKPITLRSLNVEFCELNDQALSIIGSNAACLKNLQILNLGVNNLAGPGIEDFVQMAGRFTQLFYINLSMCALGREGVTTLAEKMDKFVSLKVLLLDRNQAMDQGAIAIARNLIKAKRMKMLDFRENSATSEGLKWLNNAGMICKGCRILDSQDRVREGEEE